MRPAKSLLSRPTAERAGIANDVFRGRVTVLMTTFNCRERTLACLHSLLACDRDQLRIILVDDASSDGIAGAVRHAFADVTLIEGTGTLYWTGGTRLAFERAWGEAVRLPAVAHQRRRPRPWRSREPGPHRASAPPSSPKA